MYKRNVFFYVVLKTADCYCNNLKLNKVTFWKTIITDLWL